ncbi:MAG TPA: hypothetical protein VF258_06175, partial [Luteolibacter sp.]
MFQHFCFQLLSVGSVFFRAVFAPVKPHAVVTEYRTNAARYLSTLFGNKMKRSAAHIWRHLRTMPGTLQGVT